MDLINHLFSCPAWMMKVVSKHKMDKKWFPKGSVKYSCWNQRRSRRKDIHIGDVIRVLDKAKDPIIE